MRVFACALGYLKQDIVGGKMMEGKRFQGKRVPPTVVVSQTALPISRLPKNGGVEILTMILSWARGCLLFLSGEPILHIHIVTARLVAAYPQG